MTRRFTAKQRRYLYLLAGGCCEQCGIDLSGDFHGDHKHPFSKGGETALHNGQALCPQCNLKKGNKNVNIHALRNWQKEAFEKIINRWNSTPKAKTLIAACPGSGKTLMSCVVATEKLKDNTVSLVLVVCPTINIKAQWKEQFERIGVKAFDEASNEAMRFRRDRKDRMVGGYEAICITYAQLAKDMDLYIELARQEKTLLIADEVHHADDSEVYGVVLGAVSELATLKLALSGTPFNSSGGALAMCPFEEQINDEGRMVRKALPLYTYSYAQAIQDGSCRPLEFIKVYGVGKSTYKSLTNDITFHKIVDLMKQNKSDSLGVLLDPDGDFLKSMLDDGLKALHDIKRHDSRAGMLVVAKDKNHGSRISQILKQKCYENSEWKTYSVLEIYNDSDKAHERIKALDKDRTDIVVTVRMISEGVDVKRLRVGVYATDYRTRMFFVQFCGRMVRWEDRLDGTQHGRIIIPAHIDLLNFSREIEKMIDESLIICGQGPGEPPGPQTKELIGSETERTGDGVIFRGNELGERNLADVFFKQYPSLRGVLSETQAILAAKDANMSGASHAQPETSKPDWWKRCEQMVRAIVRIMKMNGDDDDKAYSKINSRANRHVGISRVDKMIDSEIMERRYYFLRDWFVSLQNNQELVDVA